MPQLKRFRRQEKQINTTFRHAEMEWKHRAHFAAHGGKSLDANPLLEVLRPFRDGERREKQLKKCMASKSVQKRNVANRVG